MATRDELERARAALEQATARVLDLAAEGLDAHPTPEELEHADAYAATAAMMRRRAARVRASGEDARADEELARAEQFQERADAKRAGRPMPRRLRTPAESLARVDELRRDLARLVEEYADVDAAEWDAFRAALPESCRRRDDGHEPLSRAQALSALERVLSALGADLDDESGFAPFASPLDLLGDMGPRR